MKFIAVSVDVGIVDVCFFLMQYERVCIPISTLMHSCIAQFFGARRAPPPASPRMARHIRELFMCAGAKIQNRLEKSANNNKEYGQKAATNAYVLLFHGHTNPSGQVVAYGN